MWLLESGEVLISTKQVPKMERNLSFFHIFVIKECQISKFILFLPRYFFYHFTQVLFTYKIQCIFNIQNLMSLEISIYLLNHHHNLCHKQIHHLEKYSTAPFIMMIMMIIIFNIRSIFLSHSLYNANYGHYAAQQISSSYSPHIIEILQLFTNTSSFPPLPRSHHSALYF